MPQRARAPYGGHARGALLHKAISKIANRKTSCKIKSACRRHVAGSGQRRSYCSRRPLTYGCLAAALKSPSGESAELRARNGLMQQCPNDLGALGAAAGAHAS